MLEAAEWRAEEVFAGLNEKDQILARQLFLRLVTLGEGVEEVTLTKWLKHEGDTVRELEPLLEVNTDKVDTEVPSPTAGTVLKIVAQEGVPAKVGSILAFIGKPGESLEGAATVAALPYLQHDGFIAPDVRVVLFITGGGLKYIV